MSDDIETLEVTPDDIIETHDEENSVAQTVAIAAAGMAVGVGVWCAGKKLGRKFQEFIWRKAIDSMTEENNDPDQKE